MKNYKIHPTVLDTVANVFDARKTIIEIDKEVNVGIKNNKWHKTRLNRL